MLFDVTRGMLKNNDLMTLFFNIGRGYRPI